MKDQLTIRLARPEDHRAISQVRHNAILILAAEDLGTSEAKRWAESLSTDRFASSIQNNKIWVVTNNAVIVGWIEVYEDAIAGLYVEPTSSSKGIGSLLLNHAERNIRLQGFPTAHLKASLNAENFYSQHGYVPNGKRTASDGLPMIKHFD